MMSPSRRPAIEGMLYTENDLDRDHAHLDALAE